MPYSDNSSTTAAEPGPKSETGWWTRPCGGFEVMRYAIPLIVSAGSMSLMNFTDRMILYVISPTAMSASMQGGLLFWTLVSLPMSVAAYTNTFVSQYNGSKHFHRIGPVVWHGIVFGILMMPLLLLLEPLGKVIFLFFGHDQQILTLECSYFRLVLLGSGAVIASEAAASFFYGRGKMKIVMNVNLFCVFVNAYLALCWAFGVLGFPRWELEGTAVATALTQWIRLAIFIALMLFADGKEKQYCLTSGLKFDFPLFKRLMYYGLGSGVHIFLDTLCFSLLIFLIGGLGEEAYNATTFAFTLNTFTFLPIVGTGVAVATLVGNQLGDNRPDLAERAVNTVIAIGMFYLLIFGILFLFFPNLFWAWFAFSADMESFEKTRTIATYLLRFIAFYLAFDGLGIIYSSAIKGAGDTKFVFLVTLCLAPATPLLCFIGIRFFGLGLYWCWIVLTLWVLLTGVIFFARFWQGHWKTMRVIEKEFWQM
ncbi:MAG: MATE family efflux transporter [Planctomycetaceae bacterium]|nr:MATE family efflux transporter [Planctomycetaceae bacterium]